jgi:hypothetical protein
VSSPTCHHPPACRWPAELSSPIQHATGETPFHALTPNPLNPSMAWKNSFGNMGEAASFGLEAGIDFFGR